ncbi:MAG: MFS transporter [Bacteroidota bacterium]
MSNPYAALLIRDFRLFIGARFCVTLAIQMQAVVVGWQIYEITKDPLSLGLIGLAEAIPSIVVSLYAGHLADIIQRKQIIVFTLLTLLFCSAGLLSFTLDPGSFILSNGVLPIYVVIFISGIARGFLTPAVFSFMPQLVPRELYPECNHLEQHVVGSGFHRGTSDRRVDLWIFKHIYCVQR